MPLFLPSLKKSGHLDRVHVTIANVGSRKISHYDDYASIGWGIFAPNLTIYGFDADADACDAANNNLKSRQINWTEQHIPLALGKSKGKATLYVTKHPMCSSLYKPNELFLQRFAGLSEVASLDFSSEVEITTLDNFCQAEGIDSIDFLQIDVQGADLDVLEGAKWILERGVLSIQIEVEFSPLYVNQPLFADVDTFLRKYNFSLFDLKEARRLRSPLRSLNFKGGQLLWGDAYYFRDLIQEDGDVDLPLKTPDRIFKLACIADIQEYCDYSLELLVYLTLNFGNNPRYNFADNIVEGLSCVPDLVKQGLNTLPVVANIYHYLSPYGVEIFSRSLTITDSPSKKQRYSPQTMFNDPFYQRINNLRLDHLASLGLNIRNKTVLEVGAGIGDHTSFFLDRGCEVCITEARTENLEILRSRYPDLEARCLDMDNPEMEADRLFDIVYCYGLLYHLGKPAEAIAFMAKHCQEMLLLETCVSHADGETILNGSEEAAIPTASVWGVACRPTRKWIYQQLKLHFEFVYMPITQPNHEQFPIDWTLLLSNTESVDPLHVRSVYVASRHQLPNNLLFEGVPMQQRYCEEII